jgi:DNA-binding IclR family transcriptional regulator
VGKVLLAYDQVATDLTLNSRLNAWTPKTIIEPAKLMQTLQRIRTEGIGYDDEESLVGLNCIAAPVMGPKGVPVAALSVSGPTGQFMPASQAHSLRRVCFAASRAISSLRPPVSLASRRTSA